MWASLFGPIVSDEEKMPHNINTSCQCYKPNSQNKLDCLFIVCFSSYSTILRPLELTDVQTKL